jgi:hypothetical protein
MTTPSAWLEQFPRLSVRHEHLLAIYRTFSILPASGSRLENIFAVTLYNRVLCIVRTRSRMVFSHIWFLRQGGLQ